MNKLLTVVMLFALSSSFLNGQMINEFEPNPPGGDPANQSLEVLGTPLLAFTGFLFSIECDGTGATLGRVDEKEPVVGTFDMNGILTVSIPDIENPSFTLILTDATGATVMIGDDIDLDDDGVAENSGILGTILDAIGVPDHASDFVYGVNLGFADFTYNGSEPQRIFRDNSMANEWYAVTDPSGGAVYDINGVSSLAVNPETTSFGALNTLVLPVSFNSFVASRMADGVELNWTTASERNNEFFFVQRQNEKGIFESIGKIEGAGDSDRLLSYTYLDTNPINNTNRYRIKQVDFDGSFDYSRVLSINVGSNNAFSVNPNPITSIANISLIKPLKEDKRVQVLSMNGSVLMDQIIEKDATIISLDLSRLNKGVYLLQLGEGLQAQRKRIIKI